MKIATYNLRYDSRPDNISVQESLNKLASLDPLQEPKYLSSTNEEPWSARRLKIAAHLLEEDIVLAGFQEALVRQIHDLAELLGSDWAWIGIARDDGKEAGEFCPIFYKRSELDLLFHDSFWLSNTPFEPSKYPGASCYRICEAARFASKTKHTSSFSAFSLLNTHLDDQSDGQRKLGASMLLARARYEAVKTKAPVFVTGDFNSRSAGSDSGAYKIITAEILPSPIDPVFAEKFGVEADEEPGFKMLDLRAETPSRNVSANFATYTGFSRPNETSVWARIDFIFGGANGGWNVTRYKVATALSDDGMLASDHRPVFADISLDHSLA